MNEVLFYLTIFFTHIIQGITGFAGTMLAMPVSLRLVGHATAVPVLNGLGLAAGLYVLPGSRRHVVWRELLIVLAVMGPAMLGGVVLRNLLEGRERILYVTLGVIVLLLSLKGICDLILESSGKTRPSLPSWVGWLALVLAGIVHGMFVCGGPLLIIHMAGRLRRKEEFRATLSAVWIFLNGILLITQLIAGSWTLDLLRIQLIALPVLFLAMFVGTLLYRRMNQKIFTVITYVLLVISGISLFFK